MERADDYRCPPECERRRPACQGSCPRYARYYQLNEERKAALRRERLSFNYEMEKKIHKTEGRFLK